VLGASGGPRLGLLMAFLIAGGGAAITAAINTRGPRPRLGQAASVLSVLALLAAPLAIVSWVAPHAYGTPNHLCPFCLLHGDEAMGLGWPLYVALFVAVSRGISIAITGYVQRAASGVEGAEPERLTAVVIRASVGAAIAWVVTLLLSLAPWAVFTLLGDGASLFG
jgi:hypothetical protein